MASSPFIVVVGATGKQGRACVNALLRQRKFNVKGLTRNVSGKNAKALVDLGVKLVQGDLNDKPSLIKAFEGAHGVFLFTDFYVSAEMNAEKEILQGKNAIDAAAQAAVKHLVWSSLEDPRPVAKGVLPEVQPGRIVPHFESKSEVEVYLKNSRVPSTVLLTSMFYDSTVTVLPYQKQEDGSYVFTSNAGPKAHPQCATEDIGASAAVAFGDAQSYIGSTIIVVGDNISFADMGKVISSVTGKSVRFQDVTREQYAGLGFPGAAELANMFAYYSNFSHYADLRPIDKAVIQGNTFKKWAERHANELKAAVAKGD
ncbi:hypothetical protein WJX79_009438 [Trebouxia sp. C0005]